MDELELGEAVIRFINDQNMIKIEELNDEAVLLSWSQNAAEQLGAHIKRLLDLQKGG